MQSIKIHFQLVHFQGQGQCDCQEHAMDPLKFKGSVFGSFKQE